jgi:hypothetical protein
LYAQADWGPTSYGDGGNGDVIVANYAVEISKHLQMAITCFR